MNRQRIAWIILLFLLTACAPAVPTPTPTPVPTPIQRATFTPTPESVSNLVPTATPTPTPTPTPMSVPDLRLQPAIDEGLRFLTAQYNADVGLLQESPNIGQRRYYLTNDNALAAYVVEQMGDADFGKHLRASLARYGYDSNGFIEVAWGKVIAWPPIHHKDLVVEQLTHAQCDFLNEEETGPVGDCIFHESHTPDLGLFYDWSSYANLACMGSVNEFNRGNDDVARWLYQVEMSIFDGQGFSDAVLWADRPGIYETLGLAWCLYAGALLGEPVNEQILSQLLAQQDPDNGGFHTHFRAGEPRLADPNVETTSLALLALDTLNGTHRLGGSAPVLGLPADVAQSAVVPSSTPVPMSTPTPIPGLQPAIDGGLRFLADQYNADVGLLRESRIVAYESYWLTTDNLLATYALDAVGAPVLAGEVRAGLLSYGDVRHGLIEALVGESVAWPPYVEAQSVVASPVKMEQRLTGDRYADWADYGDLALYGALNAHNAGDDALALVHYRQALSLFDGVGFGDKAFIEREDSSLYATYKLALALYVGAAMGQPVDSAIFQALMAKQETETGGFITLYDPTGMPQGDANTETTAYALLALARLR